MSDMRSKELLLRLSLLQSCVEIFRPALLLVTEWATMHRAELMEDWALARAEAQLNPIKPLE